MSVQPMVEAPPAPAGAPPEPSDPLAVHSALATAALRTALVAEGIDAVDAHAVVAGDSRQLLVTLAPGVEIDPKLGERAAVRVLAAVRALDRGALIIDVSLRT